MAHPVEKKGFHSISHGLWRLLLIWFVLSLSWYIVGPFLFKGNLTASTVSSVGALCPPCGVCDCSSEDFLSITLGFFNSSFADCGKSDPVVKEEMEKNFIVLLSEELSLQKVVANESIEHNKALTIEARKVSSHYQNEAEKCSAGVEICEEARERAARELVEERKLTALWEKRARRRGWKHNRRILS